MDCQAEREPWVDDSRISRLKGIGMIELADELVSIRKMAKEMVNECFCRTERVAEIAYASATVKQASQPREKAGKKKMNKENCLKRLTVKVTWMRSTVLQSRQNLRSHLMRNIQSKPRNSGLHMWANKESQDWVQKFLIMY